MKRYEIQDDLLVRSAERLKRLVELDAPSVIVRREIALLVSYGMMKYDDPEKFEQLCVEKALRRNTGKSDLSTESTGA
jgi:hypothetical protein